MNDMDIFAVSGNFNLRSLAYFTFKRLHGRLRRDMPRKTNIKQMTQEDFDENILNYNTIPRKSLAWLAFKRLLLANPK
jgi:hypothetical protein